MLKPKRTKYRKQQKGRNRGLSHGGNKLSFGDFALQATGRGLLTARQIEAGRRALTRPVKPGGKLWLRVLPDTPVTAPLVAARSGTCKGNIDYRAGGITTGRRIP